MIEQPAPETLSETELEILRLLSTGATNREIARTRGISEATVKKHVTNINAKLGTGNRTEAVRRALELGLVTVKTPGGDLGSGEEAEGHRAAAVALSRELERTRRRTRHLSRWLAVVALVGMALATVLVWAGFRGLPWLSPPPSSPVPPTVPAVTPAPSMWSSGVRLPSPRTGLALVAEPGGSGAVYAIGGAGAAGVLSETLRYDPRGLSWQRRAPKPTAVEDVAAAALQGRLVVPGGCLSDGAATDVSEIYDLATDSWSAGPSLPRPACGYALAEIDGRIYLLGGRDRKGGAPQRWVWSYQPGDTAWSEEAEALPLPRSDGAAVAVPGQDEIHLLGGRDAQGPQPNHWLFRPFMPSGQWATEGGPPLPEGRAGLAAAYTEAPTPAIYVIGGGWDRDVDPWALKLDGQRWSEAPGLRLAVPQRGAPLTAVVTRDGRWLATAGGQANERLLDQYDLLELVRYYEIILPMR